MTLAEVKEQDGIMLAIVKFPSIPTSAACYDAKCGILLPYHPSIISLVCVLQTLYNCQLLHRNYFLRLKLEDNMLLSVNQEAC